MPSHTPRERAKKARTAPRPAARPTARVARTPAGARFGALRPGPPTPRARRPLGSSHGPKKKKMR